MMKFAAVMIFAGALSLTGSHEAGAVGCLSGAAVGGVAGHYAGHHAILGAAAGCAVGHHARVMQRRRAIQAQDGGYQAAPYQQQ